MSLGCYYVVMITLSRETLSQIDVPGLQLPTYSLEGRRVGIVHFGVGGFHRAHQALYLDRLFCAGHPTEWAICGVGLMPGDTAMRDALNPQDGLYTLVAKAPDGSRDARVIGSLAEYVYAPDNPTAVLRGCAIPACGLCPSPSQRAVTTTTPPPESFSTQHRRSRRISRLTSMQAPFLKRCSAMSWRRYKDAAPAACRPLQFSPATTCGVMATSPSA